MNHLFDRAALEVARPWAKGLVALLGWSNSAGTMVLTVLQAEQVLTGQQTWDGWLIGLAAAVALTVAQIFLRGYGGAYLVALAPDVATTAWQWQRFWGWVARGLLTAALPSAIVAWYLGSAIGWLIGLVIGWFSARLPERLLFGPMPKRGPHAVATS